MSNPPPRPAGLAQRRMLIVQLLVSKIEFGVIGEFVDPRQIDHEQPARIVRRGIEALVEPLLIVRRALPEQIAILHHRLLAIVR